MLPETFVASFLGVCLGIFCLVNLYNLTRNRKRKSATPQKTEQSSEQQEPSKALLALIALGTMVFWFGSVLYVFLVLVGGVSVLEVFLFPLKFPFDSYVQVLGVVLTAFGCFVFAWSVTARGQYATAWEMPTDHKLVTWGPYRYVRHPSYEAYFMLFFGLFFIWLSWIALIPIVAIPGYVRVTDSEEKMLVQKFGEEYVAYQKEVGRFFPRLRVDGN